VSKFLYTLVAKTWWEILCVTREQGVKISWWSTSEAKTLTVD
jgi:hypothetical protein